MKREFVYYFIDSICEGNDESDFKIRQMLTEVSLNSITTHLMASFLQAMAEEDYTAAHFLKNEIIHFVEVDD